MSNEKDLSGIYSISIIGERTDKKGSGGEKGQDAALNKADLSYLEYGILMHYLIDAVNKAFLEMAKYHPDAQVQGMKQIVDGIE